MTPLWYLLFHLHPLFADLPVLLAYLVPHLLLSTLAANALLPGWPRLLWGTVYEAAVAFPLARATLDLLLPKSLGFKVTPKGIVSERRRFDVSSSRLTLAAAAVAAAALGKGAFELVAFGIEVEAYAFNLVLGGREPRGDPRGARRRVGAPQRREDERAGRRVAVRVEGADLALSCRDGGPLDHRRRPSPSPGRRAARDGRARLHDAGAPPRSSRVVTWREEVRDASAPGSPSRAPGRGAPRARAHRVLVGGALVGAHDARTRSHARHGAHLLAGIVRVFLPSRRAGASVPAGQPCAALAWVGARGRVRGVVLDLSSGGLGALFLGHPPAEALPIVLRDGVRWARVAHTRRVVPGVWRAGLAYLPEPLPSGEAHGYLAA